MRHLAWLVGCVLVLSCTVNSSDLDVDAAAFGTGGQPAGTGGINETGGAGGNCPRCVDGTGGQIATGGQIGTGGQPATGGQVGTGGQNGTGGQIGTGGLPTTGGHDGSAGQGGIAGQSATGGQGGSAGQSGAGGQGGSAGQSGAGGQGGDNQTCAQIQAQYTSALSAAKECAPDKPGQCQQRVDSSLSCKGCQTYVNDTTELDALAASWSTAGCDQMHSLCPLACVSPQPSHCAATNGNGSGMGPGQGGTCTATAAP